MIRWLLLEQQVPCTQLIGTTKIGIVETLIAGLELPTLTAITLCGTDTGSNDERCGNTE
ncbi:MAG: hypothetical protein WCG75_10900 [Armatimonadota bacterium]